MRGGRALRCCSCTATPTWSFVYRDGIASLRDEFRCVAVDFPGFGLSTAGPGYGYLPVEHVEVLTAFIDALGGLTGVTLVAHDWGGGPIGLAAVQNRPAVFEQLVLANTWAWPIGAPACSGDVARDGQPDRTPTDPAVQPVRQRDDPPRGASIDQAQSRRDEALPKKGPRQRSEA